MILVLGEHVHSVLVLLCLLVYCVHMYTCMCVCVCDHVCTVQPSDVPNLGWRRGGGQVQDAGCNVVDWCCYMRPELLQVSVAVGYT